MNDCKLLVGSNFNHIAMLQQVSGADIWSRPNGLPINQGAVRGFSISNVDVIDSWFIYNNVNLAVIS